MISTKLHIPDTGVPTVARPDLIDRMNRGLTRKLLLVSAPAGYGKTTIICQWIRQVGLPVIWYSMDERDNDPVTFFSYILEGIRKVQVDFGTSLSELLDSPHRPEMESIASMLINGIKDLGRDLLLVLDDFHCVSSREVLEISIFLLNYLPGNMHLVIATRSDPSIPLARLRSQNQLLEIRSQELSFTDQYAAIFFNKRSGLELSDEQVQQLRQKTEGWIAGLQLAALSIRGQNDVPAFIRDFTGDNRYIMDYLLEEVLLAQNEKIREFLFQTSMLEQFSAALCDYLLDRSDSQLVIEQLELNNMFLVPMDQERNWFRYHHLFTDLLRQCLHTRPGFELGPLHEKAGLWFEENGMTDLAINHAIASGDFDRVLYLIDVIVEEKWKTGQHEAILKYGESLPPDMILRNPGFCLYYSWVLVSAGKFREAGQLLQSAEKFQGSDESLRGKLAVASAYLHSSSGNIPGILESCSIATGRVSENDPLWYSWAWYSCGLGHMMAGNLKESHEGFHRAMKTARKSNDLFLITTIGIRYAFCELQRGKYRSAFALCTEILELIIEPGFSTLAENEWSFAGLYSTLGFIHHEWGELEPSMKYAKLGYELSGKGEDIASRVFNGIVYLRSLRSSGELKKAQKIMDELDRFQRERELFPFLLHTLHAARLGTFVHFGQQKKAGHLVSSLDLKAEDEVDGDNELLYTSYARFLLKESRSAEAEILLHNLLALARTEERIERMVEINILSTELHIYLENPDEAHSCLAEAITLAEEENMLMHFIQHGEILAGKLDEMYRRYNSGNYDFSKKFLNKVIREISNYLKRKRDANSYSLSKRELEVLRHMAEDLSNQQIAELMFVSLNTVKAHAKNINLKLEVDSRVKAVALARELQLL